MVKGKRRKGIPAQKEGPKAQQQVSKNTTQMDRPGIQGVLYNCLQGSTKAKYGVIRELL